LVWFGVENFNEAVGADEEFAMGALNGEDLVGVGEVVGPLCEHGGVRGDAEVELEDVLVG
jgi:hypothetical protein